MIDDLEQSQIQTNGLFLNADAGFDSEGFRKICSKGYYWISINAWTIQIYFIKNDFLWRTIWI